MKRPDSAIDLWSFFKPFDIPVWTCITLSLFLVGGVLAVLTRISNTLFARIQPNQPPKDTNPLSKIRNPLMKKRLKKNSLLENEAFDENPSTGSSVLTSSSRSSSFPDFLSEHPPLSEADSMMTDDSSSPNQFQKPKETTIATVVWYAYSALMGANGPEIATDSLSVKIVIGVWWFFGLIVLSSYTANLAAFLTVSRMDLPISSFDDLAFQSEIAYGTIIDTSIYKYIVDKGMKSKSQMMDKSKYVKMMEMVSKHENQLQNLTEALNRVRNSEHPDSQYAFLWDVAVINHEIIQDENCTLMTVSDTIYDKGYGIALRHGSQHRDLFSLGILVLQEKGSIEQLERKWWPEVSSKCAMQSKGQSSALTLENFAGVFAVLCGGLILASVTAICEISYHVARKRQRYKNMVMKNYNSGCNPPWCSFLKYVKMSGWDRGVPGRSVEKM